MATNVGALDMALDDVITQNKRSGRTRNSGNASSSRSVRKGGIEKRGGGGRAVGRRSTRNTSSPYSQPQSRQQQQQSGGARNNLVVSNLHHNVTEKDLYELFGQVGHVRRAYLHLAPNGKSSGVADVIYSRANDAERARTTYNNVALDGRPMKIAFATPIPTVSQGGGRQQASSRASRPAGGRGRIGGGPNRRRRDNNRPAPTQDALDADMDTYMNE